MKTMKLACTKCADFRLEVTHTLGSAVPTVIKLVEHLRTHHTEDYAKVSKAVNGEATQILDSVFKETFDA